MTEIFKTEKKTSKFSYYVLNIQKINIDLKLKFFEANIEVISIDFF